MPAVKEYCFNAYVVKEAKSNTRHCERLCPAGAVAPFFIRWLAARLFPEVPRERYVSSLCPQISESWKRIWRIYSYWIRNSYTGSYFIHTWYYFIHTRSYFIPTGSKFINLLLTVPEISDITVELTIYLKFIYTGSENTEVELSNWLILQK